MALYYEALAAHYGRIWGLPRTSKRIDRGPVWELPREFSVLEFQPTDFHPTWTYATSGMAQSADEGPLELHLFSPVQAESHVELLTVVAHFHRTGATLGLGHTVNLGRPWLDQSACSFGLISLPYLNGPSIEQFHFLGLERVIRCLWLIPITEAERDFKMQHGLEILEGRFEDSQFNYLDPTRPSVV